MNPVEAEHADNLRMYMNAIVERVSVLQQLVGVLRGNVETLQNLKDLQPDQGCPVASGRNDGNPAG